MNAADKKQFAEIFGHPPYSEDDDEDDDEPADFSGATNTWDR